MSAQVTEADLHGYVDGVLSSERRIAVEAHIAAHPEEALRRKIERGRVDLAGLDARRRQVEPQARFQVADQVL